MQLSLESMNLFDEIRKRGYAELTHGISNDEVETLISAYSDFTTSHPNPEAHIMDAMLPQAESESEIEAYRNFFDTLDRTRDTSREWHKYRTNVPAIGKPNGYTNRSFQVSALSETRGIDLIDDPKEYYHYTPKHRAQMSIQSTQYGWCSQLPSEVSQLDQAFTTIHRKASDLILRVVSKIEEVHPQISRLTTPENIFESPVRLLFYHPSEGEVLAGGHYDKSVFTLQIAESHQGLQVAKNNDVDTLPVIRNDNKAVFFTGATLEHEIPETEMRSAWHDVVRRPELNSGRSVPETALNVCSRWALIFFATTNHADVVSKSETNSRTRPQKN